ncbi:ferredoxin [Nonomuraea sp. B12E4]|uniref:ferredoxin n=1 Tax=Nonomuraea sp. B12E4 TaxID=3153564 RepID=UPI00325F200D
MRHQGEEAVRHRAGLTAGDSLGALMRVRVDMTLCQTHAQCVFAAPEVFTLNDDDELEYDATPADASWPAIEQAARACPVQAIALGED